MSSIVNKFLTALLLLPVGLCSYGQLPLPQIPAELTTTEARAEYAARHFYDSIDWTVESMTTEYAQTQAWVNFLSIADYAPDGTDAEVVATLFARIPVDFIPLYIDLAESYLLSADSELASERLYTAAMTALAERVDVPEETLAPIIARIDYLKLNSPGTLATDFEFPDADGQTVRLSDFTGKTPYLLIVFHDPDCDVCHELLNTLQTDPQWTSLRADGKLSVITPEITDELDETFRMLYTPSLYLLDKDGRVIVRNVLLDKISASIDR